MKKSLLKYTQQCQGDSVLWLLFNCRCYSYFRCYGDPLNYLWQNQVGRRHAYQQFLLLTPVWTQSACCYYDLQSYFPCALQTLVCCFLYLRILIGCHDDSVS